MAIADMLPTMEAKDLASLRANAVRLQDGPDVKRQASAADLLPLIDAELADRLAKAPPPPPKAPRKVAAKKPVDPDAPVKPRASRAKAKTAAPKDAEA